MKAAELARIIGDYDARISELQAIRRRLRKELTDAELAEDVEDLVAAGEWPDRIATRLGYKGRESLNTALNRIGRTDLAAQVRLLDKASRAYQLEHYTPMDEEVAKDKQRYAEKHRNAA